MLSALPFLLAATLPFANGERIAFLGDSITQLGTDDPRGWVNHVERAIRAETPEVSFIQAGISGHTSRDMLARVERDVLSRKPDWMFFSCGVNDAPNGYTDERKNKDVPLTEYRVNVSAIFDKCEKRGVKVIVLSQTPVVEEPEHVANANLVAYNAALKALAFERGYRYLDPGAAIRAAIERKTDKSKRALTIDGTHLNDAGNRIYADTVLAGLRNERRLSSTLVRHIKKNWQKTVRFNRTDEGTTIGLPFKYTVPCMADKFQEMYYWDTYFTNVGLILSGLTEQARDNVGNIAYLIEKFGYMPNGNRTYYLSRSQPPFFTRMVSEVYDAKPDKAWLVKMYAAAVKEHAFWQTQRRTASGLNRYSGSFRDDAQRKAIVEEFIPRTGWKMPTDPQEIRRMSEIFISYAESGWDCTSRFDWNPQENDWVDLNSLLYGMERDLERFAGILGNGEETKWRTAAEKRRALMNRVMWDEQLGMFCDHDFVKDARSQFVSAAAFYPLFVGLATPEQAKRTVALLPRIECAFGIAASQKDGIKDLQWDYPHGWACLQYVVVQGLLRYGYKDEARRIAVKYARMVERVFAETGSLWEKYDVARGKVSVSREYETPKMLGWSAGVYLAFARQLFQSSSAGEKAAKRAITGMTYNVRAGLGDEKQGWYVMPLGHLGYLPQCARVIREARPDWVAIEEIDNGMQRSGGVDQTKVLAQLTGMKGYFFPKVQYEDGVYGLALLLREEPIKIWKIELGGSGKDHTRILAAAELKDAIVCATHFSLCKENRLEAAKKLKAAFGNTKKPVFIGGDFNLEPQSEEFAALNETFVPISGTNLKTWPSHEPKATIDYVFVDRAHAPSVRVESVNSPATDLLATDHRPLVVCYHLETQKGGKGPPRDRPQ